MRPYHGRVFADYVEGARLAGGLGPAIEAYAERAGGGDGAAAVVHARLVAETGRLGEAIELLLVAGGGDARCDALVGRLRLRAGDPRGALAPLGRARAGLPSGDERREVARLEAEAYLRLGERAAAIDAFRALVAQDPDDLALRTEVADACARGGLIEEAFAQYREAERIAGADPEARSRALAARGRLHEVCLEHDDAAAAYGEARALLGRDHWLKLELLERLVRLHGLAGRLDGWCDELALAAAAHPERLEAQEELARVLCATGRADEAIAALARAAERFPDDPSLARRRLELARRHGRPEDRIALLEERLGRDASDPLAGELRLELAEALVAAGELGAARAQWERALSLRPDDAELAARVARGHEELGDGARAEELLRRALELAPADVERFGDLARHLRRRGESAAVGELLAGGVDRFSGSPAALEVLAALAVDLGEPDLAEAPLVRALALAAAESPARERVVESLAELLARLGRPDQARPLWRSLLDGEDAPGRVERALAGLVATYPSHAALVTAAGAERERARSAASGRGAFRAAIAMFRELGDPAAARELHVELLARYPDDRRAREELAELYAAEERFDLALTELDELARRFPLSARAARLRQVELLAGLGREEDAAEALEELVRAAPDRPAALEEAADAFARLGRAERAIEVLASALVIDPLDAPRHLRLARLCLAALRFPDAYHHLRVAHRHGAAEVRGEALEELHRLLADQGRLAHELELLAREVERHPFDLDAALLLAELHVREREVRQALAVLSELVARRPYALEVLERRADVYRRVGLWDEAAEDLRRVRALARGPRPDLDYALLAASLASGATGEALSLARRCDDPLRAAEVLVEHGRASDAVDLLEGARRDAAASPELDRALGEALAGLGRSAEAAEALERYFLGGGADPVVLARLGDLLHGLGDRDGALAVGRRLARAGAGAAAVRAWFERKGWLDEWAELVAGRARADPRDEAGVVAAAAELESVGAAAAVRLELLRELERLARVDGVGPPARSADHWAGWLRGIELAALRSDRDAAAARVDELRASLDGPGPPDPRLAADLAWLADRARPLRADAERLERALAAAPDSIVLLSAVADRAEHLGRHEAAARHYGALAAALESGGRPAEERRELERMLHERAALLRKALRPDVRASLEAPLIDALAVTALVTEAIAGRPAGTAIEAAEARRRRAEALARAGRVDEARRALEAELDASPHELDRWRALLAGAAALVRAGLHDDAEAALRDVEERQREMAAAAPAGAVEQTGIDDAYWLAVGALFRAGGAVARAYDLLRDLGHPGRARGVLRSTDSRALCVAAYEARLEQAAAALAAAVDGATRDEAWWIAARELHDVGVKLSELHELGERPEDALAVWERVARLLPDDSTTCAMRAHHAERGDDLRSSLAHRLAELRALEREAGQDAGKRAGWLVPDVTPLEPRARRSATWMHLASFASAGDQDPRLAPLLAVVRLRLQLGEIDAARAAFAELVALARSPGAPWVQNLLHVLGGHDLSGRGSGFYRELLAPGPASFQVLREYVRALWDEEQLEEAGRVLVAYRDANPGLPERDARSIQKMIDRNALLSRVRAGR